MLLELSLLKNMPLVSPTPVPFNILTAFLVLSARALSNPMPIMVIMPLVLEISSTWTPVVLFRLSPHRNTCLSLPPLTIVRSSALPTCINARTKLLTLFAAMPLPLSSSPAIAFVPSVVMGLQSYVLVVWVTIYVILVSLSRLWLLTLISKMAVLSATFLLLLMACRLSLPTRAFLFHSGGMPYLPQGIFVIGFLHLSYRLIPHLTRAFTVPNLTSPTSVYGVSVFCDNSS